jgi:MFS family permease
MLYKAFYFVFYAGYISFLLYVPVYFKYLGLSAIYVGLLNGIRPLMQTIGAPLWGVIGDRFRIRKIIFIVAFVVMTVKTMMFFVFRPESTLCVVTYYNSSKNIIRNETYVVKHDIIKRWAPFENTMDTVLFDKNTDISNRGGLNAMTTPKHLNIVNKDVMEMSDAESMADERTLVKNYHDHSVHYKLIYDDEESTRIFFWILLFVVCGDAFDAAVFTLADTSCLDTLGSENYGYYRLWGSAGWGIMSPIIGFTITHLTRDYCGTNTGSYFIIFYFYLGFMYLGLLFGSHFEFSYNHNDHVHQTVKSALLNFHYGIFLFVTFYAGVCYGFLLYFVNWFIDSLGGTAIVMGTATACKSIMDVLGFFLAGRIIDVLGHLNTVTVSLIAYIGAFVSYSYITEPWYAVPIEVLHAGAYALVWSASVSYLNKAAPAGSSATVQGKITV